MSNTVPSVNSTMLCGTLVHAATQTNIVLDPFAERDHFPKTGVEELCEEHYRKVYGMAFEKIEKMEDVIKTLKTNQHNENLGLVRRLAEEYESRLSTERMKHFKLQEEVEQLNFKYRKLLLDYEKLKIVLQSNLNP